MIQLVYVSSALKMMSEQELLDLLAVCRNNNSKLDVSGMLLYSGGNFMQALEGEEEVVTALYEKIAKDPRHKGIIRLLKRKIESRSFPDWSMGFRNVDKIDEKEVQGFSPILKTAFTDKVFADNPSLAQ